MSSNLVNRPVGKDINLTQDVIAVEGHIEQVSNTAAHYGSDGDVDTDVCKPKSVRKKSITKAASSEDKVKTPRKRAFTKDDNGISANSGELVDSSEEKDIEAHKLTPKKRGPKAKRADVEDDAEPATPKAASIKKGAQKIKKESTVEDGLLASNSSKKRASLGEVGDKDDGTPSKKLRSTPMKATSAKIPTSRTELTEADKLVMDMKKQNKTWAEITAAVSKLTGQQYGKSTLGNRLAKIMNNLIEWKDGDIERMLFANSKVQKETEAAIAAFKKDAENKIWSNTAKAMVELGADEYTSGAVEKAYMKEKKESFPHRATVDAVIARSSSAGAANVEGASDGGAEANAEATEVDVLNRVEHEDMDSIMDISEDVDASEV